MTFLFSVDVSVSFVRSSYSYNENHGTVNDIQVQLSNLIAQDLSVNIGGGEINKYCSLLDY